MDRVTLLVEARGTQVSCLLNPQSLTFRRRAGVRDRARLGGVLVGAVGDDPLTFTSGGATELEVDLLFDVDLQDAPRGVSVDGSAGTRATAEEPRRPSHPRDVRALTTPIWRLAENEGEPPAPSRPPRLRLIWGKSWNLACVVLRAAERLERFDASGTPRRSWLRLHLRQVEAGEGGRGYVELPPSVPAAPLLEEAAAKGLIDDAEALGETVVDQLPELDEAPMVAAAGEERVDLLATRAYGGPGWWRWLALVNGLADPLHVAAGTALRVAPLPPPGGSKKPADGGAAGATTPTEPAP